MKKSITYLLLLIAVPFLSFTQTSDSLSKVEEVFTIVEKPASFPGGHEKLKEYLKNELVYPQLAIEMNVEGHVFIQLIIEKDGSFSDAYVAKGIGGGCDEEALRLLTEMPLWTPAIENGNVVRQKMIQRIQFAVPESKK